MQIGLLVFPNVQQLDLTGPYEVFASRPGARVRLVAKTLEPVISSTKLMLKPDASFDDCPQLDVLCVPGGVGINALMDDEAAIAFALRQAEGARFVTSVCTGALLHGAAGLLRGKRATTHWASHDLSRDFRRDSGPRASRARRKTHDRRRVTAGIDFALTLVAELAGREVAEAIALNLEYAPDPPFDAGSPESAPAAAVGFVRKRMAPILDERRRLAKKAAKRLGVEP
jgi:cyclohexyl-isocyanide hydratase